MTASVVGAATIGGSRQWSVVISVVGGRKQLQALVGLVLNIDPLLSLLRFRIQYAVPQATNNLSIPGRSGRHRRRPERLRREWARAGPRASAAAGGHRSPHCQTRCQTSVQCLPRSGRALLCRRRTRRLTQPCDDTGGRVASYNKLPFPPFVPLRLLFIVIFHG